MDDVGTGGGLAFSPASPGLADRLQAAGFRSLSVVQSDIVPTFPRRYVAARFADMAQRKMVSMAVLTLSP